MKWEYFPIYTVTGIVMGLLFWGFHLLIEEIPWPKHGAPEFAKVQVYYIKNGTVACAKLDYAHCGIHLSKCTNDFEYRCLTDVSWEIKNGTTP